MDVTFSTKGGYFICRAGAIICHENCILMVKNRKSPYYSVGGRVKVGETSEEAVVREIFEETGLSMEIERLAFIHENFTVIDFKDKKDASIHEICFFYLIKTPENIGEIRCESLGDDGGEESIHWLPIDKLKDYRLYPDFLRMN